jgi:uncharacterized membrane protein
MISDAQMLEIATAVAKLFELAGMAVIVAGTVAAMGRFALGAAGWRRRGEQGEASELVSMFRRMLGRSILTGLELLVAADIIRTVAIEPTMENVLVLGVIVLIRTFLSFSLEVEIDGKWPWQKAKDD